MIALRASPASIKMMMGPLQLVRNVVPESKKSFGMVETEIRTA